MMFFRVVRLSQRSVLLTGNCTEVSVSEITHTLKVAFFLSCNTLCFEFKKTYRVSSAKPVMFRVIS